MSILNNVVNKARGFGAVLEPKKPTILDNKGQELFDPADWTAMSWTASAVDADFEFTTLEPLTGEQLVEAHLAGAIMEGKVKMRNYIGGYLRHLYDPDVVIFWADADVPLLRMFKNEIYPQAMAQVEAAIARGEIREFRRRH